MIHNSGVVDETKFETHYPEAGGNWDLLAKQRQERFDQERIKVKNDITCLTVDIEQIATHLDDANSQLQTLETRTATYSVGLHKSDASQHHSHATRLRTTIDHQYAELEDLLEGVNDATAKLRQLEQYTTFESRGHSHGNNPYNEPNQITQEAFVNAANTGDNARTTDGLPPLSQASAQSSPSSTPEQEVLDQPLQHVVSKEDITSSSSEISSTDKECQQKIIGQNDEPDTTSSSIATNSSHDELEIIRAYASTEGSELSPDENKIDQTGDPIDKQDEDHCSELPDDHKEDWEFCSASREGGEKDLAPTTNSKWWHIFSRTSFATATALIEKLTAS
ncbi:hypothetical protein P7C71_g4330, partial [Lecanoromycetidae sp. Uapishka_2]